MPETAEIEGEARSRDNAKLRSAWSRVSRAAIEGAARDTGTTVELAIRQEYAAYRWDEGEPIVQEAMRAVRAAGLEPDPAARAGAGATRTRSTRRASGA